MAKRIKWTEEGGGNIAECVAFGRIAGTNAADEKVWKWPIRGLIKRMKGMR